MTPNQPKQEGELKPCPFCGLIPEPYKGGDCYKLKHSEDCALRFEIHSGCQWFASQEAITIWNTRTSPPAHRFEAEELIRNTFHLGGVGPFTLYPADWQRLADFINSKLSNNG